MRIGGSKIFDFEATTSPVAVYVFLTLQYIGESGRKFKDRFSEHIGYVKSGIISQPTGQHFNLPGHSIANMKATLLEKYEKNTATFRKLRESFFINKFNTKTNEW